VISTAAQAKEISTPDFLKGLTVRPETKIGFVVGLEMFKKYGPLLTAWQKQYKNQVHFTVLEPGNREEASVVERAAIALSKELPPDQQITAYPDADRARMALQKKGFFHQEGLGLQADISLLRKVPGFRPKSQAEMDQIAFGLGVAALLAQFQIELQRAFETAA